MFNRGSNLGRLPNSVDVGDEMVVSLLTSLYQTPKDLGVATMTRA